MRLNVVALASYFFFLCPLLRAAVVFEKWYKGNMLSPFYGCKYAVTNVARYCETDMQYYLDCQCEDVVALGAMSYCAIENNVNLKDFVENFNENCVPLGYDAFTVDDIKASYDNATKYIETVEQYGTFNYTLDVVRVPISFEAADYKLGYQTYYDYYQNCSWAIIFGLVLLGFWLLIFTMGAVYQLLYKYMNNYWLIKLQNATWFRFYKQPLSVFGIDLGFVAINRLDSLVIAGNLIIIFVASCWNYHCFEGNFFWAAKNAQISRYVGDRTGILAMFPLNLSILFAVRNNFLLWCTGWNFASFLSYHKMMARVSVLLAAAHSIAYWIFSVQTDYYSESYLDEYWVAGVCAMIFGAAIVICANYTLVRKHLYEIFLGLHIILAVFFVVGLWYHLNPLEYAQYILPVIGVWSLDRLLRLVRMFIVFGGFRKNQITLFANENGDKNDIFLRLEIDNYNKHLFKVKDGNFGFVYFGTPLGFFQSHPFTIVKVNESESFAIVVKVKKGITSKIYKSILSSGKTSKDFRICVEGPYGTSKFNLANQYNNLSVVAVGTGIAGPIGYLNHHRNTQLDEADKNENVLYWGVKSLNVVNAFKKELKVLLNTEKKNVKLFIYCKDLIQKEDESTEETDKDLISATSLTEDFGSNVVVSSGYLNAVECVNKAFQENNSLLLMTCGLPKVCDETRYQFLKNLNDFEKKGSYNFVDESQVW